MCLVLVVEISSYIDLFPKEDGLVLKISLPKKLLGILVHEVKIWMCGKYLEHRKNAVHRKKSHENKSTVTWWNFDWKSTQFSDIKLKVGNQVYFDSWVSIKFWQTSYSKFPNIESSPNFGDFIIQGPALHFNETTRCHCGFKSYFNTLNANLPNHLRIQLLWFIGNHIDDAQMCQLGKEFFPGSALTPTPI